jgi:hypothetical protein
MKDLNEITRRIESIESMPAPRAMDQLAKEIALALWEIAGRLVEEDESESKHETDQNT